MVDEGTSPPEDPAADASATRDPLTPRSFELLPTPEFVAPSRTTRKGGVHSAAAMQARIRERLLGVASTPQTIGRYRVVRELARGGNGHVLECRDEDLDRTLAVKLLRDGMRQAATIRREALALAQIQHPRVIHVYEVGEHDGAVFLAMQRVEGRSLRVVQRGHPPWRRLVALYVEAGRGLAAAHAAGIIHRDFKADNVMVDDDDNPYVLDFGLAQPSPDQAADEAIITRSHRSRIPGTPSYMAPEQLAHGLADARTDQFAFAASLFEGVYGAPAYAGVDVFQLARTFARRDIHQPPPDHPAPRRLYDTLVRAVSYDPDDRWPSLRELLRELERVIAEPPRRERSTTALLERLAGRWTMLVVAILAVAALIFVLMRVR